MNNEEITISFKVDKQTAQNVMKYVETLPKSEQTTKPTTFAKRVFLKFAEGLGVVVPSKIEVK